MAIFSTTRKTVDEVLSAFHKTLDDLQKVHEIHIEKASQQERIIDDAKRMRDIAQQEANKAKTIISKFEILLNGEA